MGNKVTTLGNLAVNDLIDLGLRMPDGSTELFEVVDTSDMYVAVMTKNIIDFMPFNAKDNKHSGKANSYAESSIRAYLKELYQSVTKENKLLEEHTYGHKEFFLPTAVSLGFGKSFDVGVDLGWKAFKDDASRVKYPGTFAATKDEAYGPGKSDWYWTCTPNATYASHVRYVNFDGTLNYINAYYGSRGVAPALILKTSALVILIDGVWRLYSGELSSDTTEIKVGDWIKVMEVNEIDRRKGIEVGDVHKVIGVVSVARAVVYVRNYQDGSNDIFYLDQIAKTSLPKTEPALNVVDNIKNAVEIKDWIEITEVSSSDVALGINKGDVYQVHGLWVGNRAFVFLRDKSPHWFNDGQFKRAGVLKDELSKTKDAPKLTGGTTGKFETLARSYTENLSETLIAKNADYGNSFSESYKKHGLVSATIRLEDKLNRLNNLLKNEAQVDESIDDTLLDIAGYAILTLIARDSE